MHGIQRMPALLFNAPFAQLDNIYLDQYEILLNEPLHGISNHIKNLQHEIPHHVPKDKKALVKDIITSSFNTEQYRLFSGRSSNTEKEEAQFNALKTFTNLTSNHHPKNVIFNSIIHLQAKQVLNEGENDYHEEDLTFLKLYQPIKATLSDSLIPFEWSEKHATCYQVLLQQISDYLLCDIKCWQETDDGVPFFDINQPKLDVKLHHFRSSSVAGVCKYIQDCWEFCLKNCHSLIPAYKIRVYKKISEKYETVKLQILSHFEPYLAEYDHETITTKDSKKKHFR